MKRISERKQKRERRHARINGKMTGTAEKPRLVVYRSLNHIYAQIVDDKSGRTLVSASSLEKDLGTEIKTKKDKSQKIGENVAKRAIEKKIKKVVFDRNGYKYHGRVKIVAEAARKDGLEF